MSTDVVSIIIQLLFLIAGIALVFLISRSVTMGRKFVGRVYRSRAFWFAGVMLSVLFWLLFTVLYITSGNFEGIAVELALITVLLVFVYADRTVLVTLEMDFLHRNSLQWRQVRKLAYVASFAGAIFLIVQIPLTKAPACSTCPPVLLPGLPSWISVILNPSTELIVLIEFFVALVATFGYSFSAIVIGARRASDMTMKRHVRWLGLGFLIFLIAFVGSLLQGTGNILLASSGFFVLMYIDLYTFYRALMSLTFIGRVEVQNEVRK